MTRRCLLIMPTLLAAEPSKPAFSLSLQLENNNLRVSLSNITSKPQKYFYDARLQPVTLKITGPKGIVTPVDRRANAKFDRTPYSSIYKVLRPRSTILLLESPIDRNGLRWGQFVFDWSGQPKGNLQMSAAFDHQQNHWVDSDSNQSGVYPGLWRGLLLSPSVSVTIP